MAEPIRVEPFDRQSRVRAEDVVALWTGAGVLDAEEARRRVAEVALVATAGDALAGVCTTFLRVHPQLHLPMWHFRAFVAPEFRLGDIAIRMIVGTRDLLRERHVTGKDRRGAGVVMEVENAAVQRRMDEGRWPRTDFTFVGVGARGEHVRVHYFPGALVPVPRQGSA